MEQKSMYEFTFRIQNGSSPYVKTKLYKDSSHNTAEGILESMRQEGGVMFLDEGGSFEDQGMFIPWHSILSIQNKKILK